MRVVTGELLKESGCQWSIPSGWSLCQGTIFICLQAIYPILNNPSVPFNSLFTPTAESHGFSPDLLWSGLRSGLPAIALAQARRAGCRATKSRRSRSESAKLSDATGKPVGLHLFDRWVLVSVQGRVGATSWRFWVATVWQNSDQWQRTPFRGWGLQGKGLQPADRWCWGC